MPCAFITGITGQDGSYLAELLLEKGYVVHGLVRQTEAGGGRWIKPLTRKGSVRNPQLFLHRGDLNDPPTVRHALRESSPDEIYHLAGQTHVGRSFKDVEATCELIGLGTLRLLEMVHAQCPAARVFHASSSEVFGRPETVPQDEQTPFRPVTPYGCAKAFASNLVSLYRSSFGLFACNGILYNHESPRRGEGFVTQKICVAAAAIKEGRQQELRLGNLTGQRDWGDARDYVRGMWLALQHPTAEDFVLATGEQHTVQDVLDLAFATVGLDWRQYVRQDQSLLRPEEPARLVGNPAKARRLLNWTRTSSFQDLIAEMTRSHLRPSTPPRRAEA